MTDAAATPAPKTAQPAADAGSAPAKAPSMATEKQQQQSSSSSSSALTPSPTPKKQSVPLSALIKSLPSNFDSFLARLDKCLSTPAGIDTVMLFLCYTSKFASAALGKLSQSALRRSAREWIALVAALPRGTTVVFSSPASAVGVGKGAAGGSTALAARALTLSKCLANLSSMLSEARMILRLWALIGMYFWAKGLVKKALCSSSSEKSDEPKPSKAATLLESLRLALCVAFQALENAAYLGQRGILPMKSAQVGKAYIWSARLWGAYVGIELGRLAAERLGPNAPKTAEARSRWAKNTARQLAWAPLTVHWGSEKPLVSELTVGLLASIPGIIQLRDLWASTA